MQVASKHGNIRPDNDAGGCEMVARLREAWLGERPVEVRYALVTPRERTLAFNARWELGDGLREGEAYVNVCGVCRVEDVFGVRVRPRGGACRLQT